MTLFMHQRRSWLDVSGITGISNLSSGTTYNSGNVTLQGGDIFVDNSLISANNWGSSNIGGTMKITGDNVSILNKSAIGSDTGWTGKAGTVEINASKVLVDGTSNITTDTYDTGAAGTVNIKGGSLTVSKGGKISSDTYATGNAGSIALDSNDTIINGGLIYSRANLGSAGNAGTVTVNGNTLNVSNSGIIDNSTSSSGNAGDIAITTKNITVEGASIYSSAQAGTGNAGNIHIDAKTGQLALNSGGVISSSTWTAGNAGSINIDAGQLAINGQGKNATTGIFSTAETGSSGKAGNLILNVNNDISLVGGGSISSSTKGQGNAGNLSIYAGANITVDSSNAYTDAQGSRVTNITSSAKEGSTGNAGNVFINAPNGRLLLANAGKIQSSSNGTGDAGNVTVQAKQIQIEGKQNTDLETGIISDALLPTSFAKAGVISLSADEITLNGGTIRSNTFTKGDAGQIVVDVKNGLLSLVNGSGIKTNTYAEGNAGNVTVAAKKIFIDRQNSLLYTTGIMSEAQWQSKGNAGNVSVTGDELTIQNGGQISSATFAKGNAGAVNVNAGQILIDGKYNNNFFTGISSNANSNNSGKAGGVIVNANNLALVNGGEISSSTFSSISAAGLVQVNAGTITLDNAAILAKATTGSSGQTGNINITATQAVNLRNNAKISLENDANIANPSAIIPTSINISAPDIDLKNSSITTEATGNVDASDININFSHWLTMDPSFITTSANTGNGGTITIRGGELIYLQNSGFLTSVSGANSNGGNINVSADYLVMDTGVIQANAVGGSGGDINLNLKALLPSQNRLILGGSRVVWRPFVSGLNVIQAASENGVNGSINVTSPQFDISASVSGLDSAQLVMPNIDRNLCQSSAMLGSSLARGGQGGIPADEARYSYIPLIAAQSELSASSITTTALAQPSTLLGESFPCVSLQP